MAKLSARNRKMIYCQKLNKENRKKEIAIMSDNIILTKLTVKIFNDYTNKMETHNYGWKVFKKFDKKVSLEEIKVYFNNCVKQYFNAGWTVVL